MTKLKQLVGQAYREDAEVMVIFRVKGKYYPATDHNLKLFEDYIYSGNEKALANLDNELEV